MRKQCVPGPLPSFGRGLGTRLGVRVHEWRVETIYVEGEIWKEGDVYSGTSIQQMCWDESFCPLERVLQGTSLQASSASKCPLYF